MKKILITGGRGFIGSHLQEYLQRNYPDYALLVPSKEQLDLYDEQTVDAYIKANRIDTIIHLANRGGGRDTIDMKNVTEYNLRIFFNIAKYADKVDKIISFGSGAEYGKHKPIVKAKEEEYLKEQPLDEYGFYKSITSRFIEKSSNIVQLRIFGAYGEYENYRYKFISNTIVKNLLHLPITIYKNVFFDYIYIDDLIKIIDWFIHNESKEKVYNASTGERIDLLTLAKYVNAVSDFHSDITILNEGLNNEYTACNERLLKEIGNFRFIPHEDAIKKMRAYFQKNIEKLDIESVKNDPYLKKIDRMWQGK